MKKLSLTLIELGSILLIMFLCFFVLDMGEKWVLHQFHLKKPDETLNFVSQIFLIFILYQNSFQIVGGKVCKRPYPLTSTATMFLVLTAMFLFVLGVLIGNM